MEMQTAMSGLAVNSADIEAALAHLRRRIGTARASATVVYGLGRSGICLSHNWSERDSEIGRTSPLPTLDAMLVEAGEIIRAWHATRRNNAVRRLALAIIEITDEHTRCTRTLLQAKGFSTEEIAEFEEAACQRASDMCANAPFSVEDR